MERALRILHVPGRTPYARKLHGRNISIVNETDREGVAVPRDASFEWIERQSSFGFFDVLHVQSLELADFGSTQRVFERCAAEGKGVVVTLHELAPLFQDENGEFDHRVQLACRFASAVVTLTRRAGEEIARRFDVGADKLQVIPHGPVLPIPHPLWTRKARRNRIFSLGMFGGVRPNRSFLTAAVNALHGLDDASVRVNILTRGLNPIELGPASEAPALLALAGADRRLSLKLLPFPSDDEIADFVHTQDALVLPYLHGTHSGQLELAMDLGVRVIAPDIGSYREQWRLHASIVAEPFWFECDPAQPYSYGTPLLRAIRAAHASWRRRKSADRRAVFRDARERELAEIVSAHAAQYARAMPR